MQVDSIVELIELVADATGKTAIEKFNKLIEQVQVIRRQNRDELYKLYDGFLKQENILLREKIEAYTLQKAVPPYLHIVRQGIAEGTFHTVNPELAVETIIRTARSLRLKMAKSYLEKDTNENYREEIANVADFMEEFVSRILGVKSGSIQISFLFKSFFQ